jgi:transcription termination factor Rho
MPQSLKVRELNAGNHLASNRSSCLSQLPPTRATPARQLLHPLNVVDSVEFMIDKISRTESNAEFLEAMGG